MAAAGGPAAMSPLHYCVHKLNSCVVTLATCIDNLGHDGRWRLSRLLLDDSYRFNALMLVMYALGTDLLQWVTQGGIEDPADLNKRLRLAVFYTKYFAGVLESLRVDPYIGESIGQLCSGFALMSSSVAFAFVLLFVGSPHDILQNQAQMKLGVEKMYNCLHKTSESTRVKEETKGVLQCMRDIHQICLPEMTIGVLTYNVNELSSMKACGDGLVRMCGKVPDLPLVKGWGSIFLFWQDITLEQIPNHPKK